MIYSKNERLGHLLMHVCRLRGKTADQFMDKSNLYRGQGILLMFISKHGGWTHSEIAEKLNISPAATTKVIKRLEKEGYLERRSDKHDERISRVFLQEEGQAVIEEIRKSFNRLDQKTFNGFSNEELEKFQNYLDRILQNLKKN